MSYSSLNEITQRCNSEGIPFWKAVQYSDMEEREVTEQASFQMMQKMWNAMKAAGNSYDKDQKSRSGLVGGMGGQMRSYMEKGDTLSGDFMSESDCTGIGDGRVECLYAPDCRSATARSLRCASGSAPSDIQPKNSIGY